VQIENQLRLSARPMYLCLAGNDTVPFSVWRGWDLHAVECC